MQWMELQSTNVRLCLDLISFVSDHHLTCLCINTDGRIGEALIKAMASLDTLEDHSEQMWGRAYSRFIRALM